MGVILNYTFKGPALFLNKAKTIFTNKIKKALMDTILKLNSVFRGDVVLPTKGSCEVKIFDIRNRVIDNSTNFKLWYRENVHNVILNKLSEYSEKKSGWSLNSIINLKVNINHYQDIAGS